MSGDANIEAGHGWGAGWGTGARAPVPRQPLKITGVTGRRVGACGQASGFHGHCGLVFRPDGPVKQDLAIT